MLIQIWIISTNKILLIVTSKLNTEDLGCSLSKRKTDTVLDEDVST